MKFNHRVEQAISTPRLTTYRAHAFSDEQAWALYRWNIELSAAIAPIAADVELATLGWVHWHNHQRLHTYLGDVPPAEFEAAYAALQPDHQTVGNQ